MSRARGALLVLTVMISLPRAAAPAAERDLLLADFEAKDYGRWEAQGTAFGAGPARGTLPGQQAVSGFEGAGLANSFLGGDAALGTLTSPEFRIERRFINFLIGGGRHPQETCVELVAGAEVLRSETGWDSERLEWATWAVGDLAGRTVRIRLADRHAGGWGHVNADQFVMSDERQAEEIVASVPYEETYRPRFHFTARKNWLNDPNGLAYYQGEYHLFFQHNPSGINWGNMTWGHAVSRDLVRWEQIENALLPDSLGTIFSGSAVVDRENTTGFGSGGEKPLVVIYTSAGGTSPESKGQPFTQSIAWSVDRGRTWTKYEKNPGLAHVAGGNRDPKVVWHAPSRKWIMTLFLDQNRFAFFSSPDLKSWSHLHDLEAPGCSECPDFFELAVDGDPARKKWVWTAANGHYLVGSFDGRKFSPEGGPRPSDRGRNFYAVQTYSDLPESDGRRIQVAWMSGGRYPGMPFNQQMSFPCELTLRTFPEGLRLFRRPVREIESLRGQEHRFEDRTLKPAEDLLAEVTGELFDIIAEVEPGDAAFGLRVRGEPIECSLKERKLTSLGASADLEPSGGRIDLRILADRASLEVFAQEGRVSLTSCFLPRGKKSLGIYAAGEPIRIVSLKVYALGSAWSASKP